jgi:hypothetical protein
MATTKQEAAQTLAAPLAKNAIDGIEAGAADDRALEIVALQMVSQALAERAQILMQRETADREAFLESNAAAYRTHRAAKEVERKAAAGARAAIEK